MVLVLAYQVPAEQEINLKHILYQLWPQALVDVCFTRVSKKKTKK